VARRERAKETGLAPRGGRRAQTTEAALNWIFIVKCGECVWGRGVGDAGRNGRYGKKNRLLRGIALVLFGEEEEDTTAVTIRKRLLTVGIYLAYHFLPLPTPHELFLFFVPHLTTQFI